MVGRLLGFACASAVFAAGLVHAPPAAAEESAAPPPVDAGDTPKKKKKKKHGKAAEDGSSAVATGAAEPARGPRASKRDRLGRVEVFGRVAARAELERHEQAVLDPNDELTLGRVDSLDLSVPLARVGVHYRAPAKWLSAEIEIDVADGLELLDAWAQAKNENFSARAGQFKLPFSAIELESSFTLPMVRRGLVHDILVDELEIAGRRPGIALGARAQDDLRPSLVIGAFQGSVLTDEDRDDRDVERLSERALDAQSAVARAEARVWDVTFGLNYEHRVGTDIVLEPEHFWTFGADAVLDTENDDHGLRVWAEVLAGASWFEHRLKPIDTRDATFVSLRLITAFRFGGTRREAGYIEPYGMLSTLDPDTDVASDLVVEEVLGVNVGLWRRVRVGLELELEKAQPNFPARYFLGENTDRKAVVLGGQIVF